VYTFIFSFLAVARWRDGEKIKLVNVLALKSRHIVASCWVKQRVYKGFTKGVTGSHICWADRHCWISQRKVNVRLYKENWSQPPVPYCSLGK